MLANGKGAPGLEINRRRLPEHLLIHRQRQAQVLHVALIMLDEDQVLVQRRVERLQVVEERVAVQELAEEEVGEGEVRDDAFEDSAAEEPAGEMEEIEVFLADATPELRLRARVHPLLFRPREQVHVRVEDLLARHLDELAEEALLVDAGLVEALLVDEVDDPLALERRRVRSAPAYKAQQHRLRMNDLVGMLTGSKER